jgi:immune inhibitor A
MDQSPRRSPNWTLCAIIGVLLVCVCAIVLAGGAFILFRSMDFGSLVSTVVSPAFVASTEQPAPTLSRPPAGSVPTETAEILGQTLVPDRDLYDLACRLRNTCGVSHTLPAPATPLQVGDRQKFWVRNSDTSAQFQVNAVLRYITPHSYFWVADGIDASDKDIASLMNTFENKIYPTDREFFGSEWTPGVDNDPHICVVYARGLGQSVAGYFSAPDEYNPLVYPNSNGHEMFVFSADGQDLTDQYTYSVLTHEFQHMIHWNLDRNESSWMNEGFSEVAMLLNGYSVGGVDISFARSPDLSLTDWTSLTDNPGVTSAHYGESFLFLTYFLDRFGDQVTRAVVQDQENSLTSVDVVLQKLNITDNQTGQPITADDVVMDWMATLYLHNGSIGDGRYTYHNYPSAPRVSATGTVSHCPASRASTSVNQYGADYIAITCVGDHTLSFVGSTQASLIPPQPHSGKYALWSNKGDESDMTLTHDFDLSSVTGPISFSYWTWYDLEKGYDYLYLEASTDGQHWDILKTPSCSANDLSGNAYGCGYTGRSGGGDETSAWIDETVDLSQYAGRKIQLRFEYITDEALNGEGLLLDDVSLPAVNYSSDFETDDGGWTADGFARIQNSLPQTFRLSMILKSQSGTAVQYIPVTADETADIPLSLREGDSAVLIVTGTQRFTRLAAAYTIEIK